jgi:hypothetical protein
VLDVLLNEASQIFPSLREHEIGTCGELMWIKPAKWLDGETGDSGLRRNQARRKENQVREGHLGGGENGAVGLE